MEPTPSRTLVLKKLGDCFPDSATAAAAMDLLDSYGLETWHREKDRVQLAILKLSGGNLEELRRLVDMAKTDYRDVLAYAEYPGEFRSASRTPPHELDAIRQRDREQYLAWLGSHEP